MISYIWSSTTRDRALRRLAMDFYVWMNHPAVVERQLEELHPDFVKDLALEGLKELHGIVKNKHPGEQRPGHYHELDKPYPCSNIHSQASVELRGAGGEVVDGQSTLFATPRTYMDVVHHKQKCYHDHEVSLQMGVDSWAVVKESNWGESFGKVSIQGTPRQKLKLTTYTR
jgi:hypothetical protein